MDDDIPVTRIILQGENGPVEVMPLSLSYGCERIHVAANGAPLKPRMFFSAPCPHCGETHQFKYERDQTGTFRRVSQWFSAPYVECPSCAGRYDVRIEWTNNGYKVELNRSGE